jgi:hypothetical protein
MTKDDAQAVLGGLIDIGIKMASVIGCKPCFKAKLCPHISNCFKYIQKAYTYKQITNLQYLQLLWTFRWLFWWISRYSTRNQNGFSQWWMQAKSQSKTKPIHFKLSPIHIESICQQATYKCPVSSTAVDLWVAVLVHYRTNI